MKWEEHASQDSEQDDIVMFKLNKHTTPKPHLMLFNKRNDKKTREKHIYNQCRFP